MDVTVVSALSNVGVAGIFLVLFLLGHVVPKSVVDDLRAERDALKSQVAAERDRAEVAVAAAQASRDLMAALHAGAALARRGPDSVTTLPPGQGGTP